LRKLINILGLSIILTGCSIAKRGVDNSAVITDVSDNRDIITIIENQNLTSNSFFIQKADVEIVKDGESESFIASIKYNAGGSYLISLRGKSGIEAARIYITKDTILINDRINRQLLFGEPVYLERKFGLPIDVLPLIFGDLSSYSNETDDIQFCVDGTMKLERNVKGIIMKYIVDCKKKKIVSAVRVDSFNTELARLRFDKFTDYVRGFFPTGIRINYIDSEIFIKIVKFEAPWDGDIEFVPGNKYEEIELL